MNIAITIDLHFPLQQVIRMSTEILFEPQRLHSLTVNNRLVVAPMTRVSAAESGEVGPLMKEYYMRFAQGGFGLIITEGLYTDGFFSQGYKNQPGMVTEAHMASWQEVNAMLHSTGTKVIAQLMHAGALSQYNRYSDITAGPSAVRPKGSQMPSYGGEGPYRLPKAMSQRDINNVIAGFANAALLAQRAGFDGVELHAANGYLLDQFLTDYTNFREDEYGGDFKGKAHIIFQIIRAVREAVNASFVVGIRFSQKKVNDYDYEWQDPQASVAYISRLVRDAGAHYIHTVEPDLNNGMYPHGQPFSTIAKDYSGLPIIANGGVVHPDQAVTSINQNGSDFISIGRAALANQDWPTKVKNREPLNQFNYSMLLPSARLVDIEQF